MALDARAVAGRLDDCPSRFRMLGIAEAYEAMAHYSKLAEAARLIEEGDGPGWACHIW